MATYIGKVKVDGTNELPVASTLYGTCSTVTGNLAKVVTCANFDKLITGVTIAVNFTVANTADGTLTLNVNSTGAKTIYYRGAALARPNNVLLKGVCLFVYDGTYWHLLGNYIDTNTTYTANTTKLATTTVPNVTSAGSAPTLGTAIPADDITAWTTNTATTPVAVSVSGGGLSLTSGSKGTSASLSYTAKSIPNVTSVGSAPTLGTAITVATGSTSSSGSGATVATGITAS